MIDKETQKAWINAVKSCGQSLIDYAESIAGDYEFQTDVDIYIILKPNSHPEISVTHNYFPRDINNKTKQATTYSEQQGQFILNF